MEKSIITALNSCPVFLNDFFEVCKDKKINPSNVFAKSISETSSLFYEVFIERYNYSIDFKKGLYCLLKDNKIVVSVAKFKDHDEGVEMFILSCIIYINNPF